MTNVHIWRQDIVLVERQTITAPGLRRILAVDDQRGVLEAWFEVVPGQPERSLDLIIVGTGHEIPDDVGNYIGHLVAFPTEWPRRIVQGWSPEGGVVLDPFSGTGTTALVASVLGTIATEPLRVPDHLGTDIPAGGTFVWHFYTADMGA